MSFRGNINIPITADLQPLDSQLRAGVGKLDAFGKSTEAVGKKVDTLTTASKKAADSKKQLTSSLKAGNTEFQKSAPLITKTSTAMGGLTKKQQALKGSTGSVKTAFQQSGQQFGKYIASLGAVGMAVGLLKAGLKGLADDAMKGKEAIAGIQDPNRRLSQVASSASDLQRMQGQADAASLRYGIGRDEARNLMFSARSEGFEEDFGAAAQASTLLGSEATSTVAGSFRGLFRGRQDLSVKQALSGVLASAQTSRLDFGEMAQGAQVAAESSASAGTSAEELLASLGVMSSRFKSGLTAGDRLKAFQAQIGKSGLGGGGILSGFEQLRGMSEEDRTKAMGGSVEVKAVYDALIQDADKIRAEQAKIAADMVVADAGGGALATSLNIQSSDVGFRVSQRKRQEENREKIALEQEGRLLMEREIAMQSGRNAQRESGSRVDNLVGAAIDSTGLANTAIGRMALGGAAEASAQATRMETDLAALKAERLAAQQLAAQKEMVELLKQNAQPEPPVTVDSLN